MPVPDEISQLVELFERNYDQYCAPTFTEAAVRHQFIDPFFIALGWDVNNTQAFADQYKEVIHEAKVRVAGAAKASADIDLNRKGVPHVRTRLHPAPGPLPRHYRRDAQGLHEP